MRRFRQPEQRGHLEADPVEELEVVAGEREVWPCLLRQLLLPTGPG